MALFRLAGRRTLADIAPFDLVLLLIISELVQQAIVADDPSLTNALILCTTLVLLDIGLSLWKQRSPRIERWLEGPPVLLVQHGEPIQEALRATRVDEARSDSRCWRRAADSRSFPSRKPAASASGFGGCCGSGWRPRASAPFRRRGALPRGRSR